MANPKINISSLDFNGIKLSLKAYLNTKAQIPGSPFYGYDFNGSVMNILLDVLAYNTLFYGYYTNMIANETFLDTAQIEKNVIRLTNVLGVLVPNKTCAKSTINASASTPTTIVAYSSAFSGSDISGAVYKFYSISDITVSTNTVFDVYEANSVANKIQISVDIEKQSAFLGTNIDPRTVSVYVNGIAWSKYDGSVTPNNNSTVFYVERTTDGFQIVFGKKNSTDYASSYGKQITSNDTVLVSYLVPTGSVANNITSIANSLVTINSTTTSAGGSDTPDLDSVKFSAPKIFAANERAVTADDYYGLLLSSSLLPASITKKSQVNVWGGDDATPTAYGRLFVSFADTGLTANSTEVKTAISFLKSKAIVGTLPEYVQPQPITAYINLDVTKNTSENLDGFNGIIENYYNTPKRFNNDIRIADIKTVANANFSNIKNINLNSLYFILGVSGSDGQKLIHFKNELMPGSTSSYGASIKTSGLSYSSQTIYLADTPVIFNSSGTATEGKLVAVNSSLSPIGNFGYLGYTNYSQGYAVINENVLGVSASIDVTGYPRYKDSTTIKDEFILTTSVSSTITTG